MVGSESLTSFQREQVKAFKEFSSIDDDGLAVSFLRRSEWNLSIALERAFSSSSQNDGEQKTGLSDTNAVPRVAEESGDNHHPINSPPLPTSLEYTDDMWREWLVRQFHIWRRYVGASVPTFTMVWLPRIFSEQPVVHFTQTPLDRFRKKYGPLIPNFQARPLVSVMGEETHKPIFIYLHSPSHDDTDAFCSQSLTNEEVINYLDTQFISWFGSVATSKGYNIATRMLRVTRYPYIAVLSPFQGRANATRFNAVFEHMGPIGVRKLMRGLRKALDKFQMKLAQNVARQMQLNDDRELRAQQENDYSNMINEEKQRIISKRAREEEERTRKQQEEQKARAEKEQIEIKRAQLDEAKGLALSMLPEEPGEGEVGIVRARIRFPDGSSKLRRFRDSDLVRDVFNFVICCEPREADSGEVVTEFTLVSTFPRRTLKKVNEQQTLESLGLIRSMNLFVEPT